MASWYAIRARGRGREDARSEVAIYDEIGAYGVSAKGFLTELGALPRGHAGRSAAQQPGRLGLRCGRDPQCDQAP